MAPKDPKPTPTPKGWEKTRADLSLGAYDLFSGIGRNAMNFAESLGNYFGGKDQAAAGQGAGDLALAKERLQVQQNLGLAPFANPVYAPTQAPAAGAPLSIQELAARRAGASQQGGAPAPGAANPGNVSIAPLGARAREQAMAERLGMEYIPGQAAGTAQAAYDQQQLRNQIEGNYSGASQSIANQIAAAQDRYGKNQADIKNIFGTLSTIRAADKQKIAQQFANSIQAAQDRAAAMTAQAQQQLQLGQQGAATAGSELGGGPTQMPTDSLTSQAVAQGIADQNANQGTWANLMQGMGLQQQGNVDTAVQGYNLQQAGALDALRRGYEESMLGLEGQQLSLQDQIAQAMSGAQAAQAGAQSDWALQQLKNQGALDVAQTRAAARGSSGGSADTTPKYSKDIFGFQQRVNDAFGADGYTNLMGTIEAAKQLATKRKTAAAKAAGQTNVKAPSKSEILSAWNAVSGMPELLPYAQQAINNY